MYSTLGAKNPWLRIKGLNNAMSIVPLYIHFIEKELCFLWALVALPTWTLCCPVLGSAQYNKGWRPILHKLREAYRYDHDSSGEV